MRFNLDDGWWQKAVSILSHTIPALVLWFGIAWPWILLKSGNISQIGFNEESVGYRYFHSLRIVYGHGEYPWLPQGQLLGLVHFVIQILLTALGHPIVELHPRIELFADSAIIFNHLCIVAAFVWAFRPIGSLLARLGAAGLLIIGSYARSSFNWGMHLHTPDYPALCLVGGLIMAGWLIRRVPEGRSTTTGDFRRLGIFGGLSVALKISFAVFPLVLGVYFLLNCKEWRTALRGILWSTITGILSLTVVIWLYYLGNVLETVKFFQHLSFFLSHGTTVEQFNKDYIIWRKEGIRNWPPDLITLSMATPILCAWAALFPFRRSVSLSLMIGGLASTYISATRFYGGTNAETNTYFVITLTILASLVVAPRLIQSTGRWRAISRAGATAGASAAYVLATMVVLLMAYQQLIVLPKMTYEPISMTGKSDARLSSFLAATPGMTLFLIPDNAHRPLTVDSAIFKGGTDLTDNTWGQSPLMLYLFPDRWYLYQNGHPEKWGNTVPKEITKMVYTYFSGEQEETKRRLAALFQVDFSEFDCPFEAPLGNAATLVGCERHAVL